MSAPAFANSATWRSGRSIIRCTSSIPPAPCPWSASEATISGPSVIGGTKCPSITSQWMTLAPASMTSATCWLRGDKSGERIDGATRGSPSSCVCTARQRTEKKRAPRGRPFRLRWRKQLRLHSVLLAVLARRLGAVFARVVPRLGRLANDLLARGVHDVGEVRQDLVVAVAAVDDVLLAVAGVELVVARAAVQGVAEVVWLARHVVTRQGPQVVIAVVAEHLVAALVGEDSVIAGSAVEGVVAAAAGDEVVGVAAVDGVVALAPVQ